MRKRPMTNRKQLTGTLLGLFLLSLTTPAFAENRAGAYSLSPFVGGHTFDGKQDLETSPIYGLRAGYNFTETWGAEAVFGYTLAEAEAPNYPETDVYSYGVEALYHFNPRGNFLLLPVLPGSAAPPTIARPHALGDDTDWLFNYGLGAQVLHRRFGGTARRCPARGAAGGFPRQPGIHRGRNLPVRRRPENRGGHGADAGRRTPPPRIYVWRCRSMRPRMLLCTIKRASPKPQNPG